MKIKILILLFPFLVFSQESFSSKFFSKENISFKKVADSLSPKIYEYIYPISENRAVFRTYTEKMGVMDSIGNVVIKPTFDFIGEFREKRAEFIISNSKYKRGIIDELGKIVIKPKYDYISYYENGVAVVQRNTKFNVINREGKEFFINDLDHVLVLSDKLLGYSLNGKYGLIDNNEVIVKNPFFDSVERFSEGLSVVKINNKQYVINELGEIVFECENYNIVGKFKDNLGVFKTVDSLNTIKYGLVNNNGKIVVSGIYDFIYLNHLNFYIIKKDAYYGVIDKFSKLIIPPSYEYISSFNQNIFIYKKNGFEGMINSLNEILLPNEYQFFYKSNKKIFANYGESSGEIDLTNFTFKKSLNFDKIINNGSFSTEYFIVKKESKFGLINENEQIIVPIIYDEIKYPLRKIIAARVKDKYGVIDITNKILKPFEFSNISQLKAGYLLFKNKQKETVYDTSLQ